MNEIFQRDFGKLVSLIGSNNIVETSSSLKKLINTLMDEDYSIAERAELSIENSMKLLEFYGKLRISQTPSLYLKVTNS